MFKDPNQESQNPYELLGLKPDASLTAVHRALPPFLRNPQNRPRIPEAMEAQRKLKIGRDRVAVDVWLYELDPVPESRGEPSEPPLVLEEFRRVPHLSPEAFYSDLDGGDLPLEVKPMEFLKVKVSDLKRYGDLGPVELLPEFDR